MSASMEVMPPGGHETYATSIFSKIKTYLDSNPYKPVKGIPNTPIDIATFTDGSDLPMPKLEVAIEPYQAGSGDPSPENVRPISGWDEVNVGVSGVNVWDEEWELGSINTGTGENIESSSIIRSKNYILVNSNTAYYHLNRLQLFFYDKDKNYISYLAFTNAGVFTTPNNAVYMRFTISSNYGTTYNNDISINYPSTDTSYHAYNGQTYNIQFKDGDNPLTVYGGTLDVIGGVLTVDRGILTLNGSEDYYTIQSSSADGNTVLRAATIQACKQNENQKSNYATFNNYAWQNLESRANTFVLGSEGNLYLQLPSSIASTVADFKALFASTPLQVVYELVTPQTIQLTPTQVKSLLGVNNIWADTGDVLDGEYIRDKYDNMTAKYASYAYNSGNATTASKLGSSNIGSATQPIYLNGGTATACTYTLGKSVPSDAVFTDTKNTAGSTDTSSKLFLIGATSQAANPQTYSQDTAYVGTDGCLYSGGSKVLTAHQDISGKADMDDLAREYSSDTVQLYHIGDLVYYDGDMYRCINGTSGGNWISSCWQHTRVAVELENKIEGLNVGGSSGGSYQSEITTSIWFDPDQFNYITGSHKVELNSNFDPSNKVNKAGDTMTGALIMSTANFAPASGKDSTLTAGTSKLYKNGLVISNPATANDQGWIRVLGTAESDTILEIATGDDGGTGEQIVARQYNTSNAVAHQVILLDTAGNFRCGNTTIYSSGSNGGRNSMLVGDDCKLGDCNVGGMLGLQAASGTNCGIRLYNGSGGLIGGFQSTNGTPQWINSSGTATNISLNGHGHSYLPLSGGTLTGNLVMGSGSSTKMIRCALYSRVDTGDSGYCNFVNNGNSAYTPIRASGFVTMSSKHVKTNIQDISDDDAKKLLDIRPINFDYMEEVGGLKNQIGVLAEDTYEILPKVVSVPDDYVEKDFDISMGIQQPLPSVDYAKFVPYLIKMVQIQQKEIDILKKERT